MRFDPRVILLFGANALLLHLTLMVDSALAARSLHLVLIGPMAVLPALYLHRGNFLLCAILTGLWVDAALPAPFGLFTLGLPAIGTAILSGRMRFRAKRNLHPSILAHLANLGCILLLTATAGADALARWNFWVHALSTLLLSHIALLVVAPWFFNLQRLLFDLFNVDTEPEDLPFL